MDFRLPVPQQTLSASAPRTTPQFAGPMLLVADESAPHAQ
jgi:hypothetical protein